MWTQNKATHLLLAVLYEQKAVCSQALARRHGDIALSSVETLCTFLPSACNRSSWIADLMQWYEAAIQLLWLLV